jgi:dihydroorotate dehydrogenase
VVGAAAVEVGTVHFAEPNAGTRIIRELGRELTRLGVDSVDEIIGTMGEW